MTDNRVFGFDFSKYDGMINWSMVKQHNPKPFYAGMRATISWAYVDPFFKTNRLGARQVDIPCLPYSVLYPGEDYVTQANNFLAANDAVGLGSLTWDRSHPVLDVELDHGQTQQMITDKIMSWSEYVQVRVGKRPVVYSRASWIDQFTLTGAWRNSFQWWLARYNLDQSTECQLYPYLPVGVGTYLIHQTADKYAVPVGMSGRLTVDVDRWNGTVSDIQIFFGETPAMDIESRVSELELDMVEVEADISELTFRVNNMGTSITTLENSVQDLEKRMNDAEITLDAIKAL